jgi:hypothetical protein
MVTGYSLVTGQQDIIDYVVAENEIEAYKAYEERNPECEANEILMELTEEEFAESM